MQRDYILRMIEQAAAVLREVLARLVRRTAGSADVGRDLQRAAHLGGLELDLLRLCDAPTLLQIVGPAGEPDPTRAWLAGEILFLDGLAARLEGRSGPAVHSLAKARLLFGLLEPSMILPTGFPEVAQRLREIESYLGERPTSASAADASDT
jgi:hypothetical protein